MADYTKIEKVPEVPTAIKEAVNNNRLVVFIGAGVSRILGCMGWDQLAANLINICFTTKSKEKSTTCITFKEKETLSKEKDHKKIITICYHILEKNGFKDIFFEEFDKSLDSNNKKEDDFNIYKEVFGLRGINITTNADKHFDKMFTKANLIFNIDEFAQSSIDRAKLYKIHGTQDIRKSLVFTVQKYILRYNHFGFRSFLEKIFAGYTVLFIGYGMSEFELLDFLITKFDSSKKAKGIKHYILLPFYSGEENILQFEQSYYNSMGVQVIGYEKDEKGYNQLYDVIKEWNTDINKTSTFTLDSFKEIEDIVGAL